MSISNGLSSLAVFSAGRMAGDVPGFPMTARLAALQPSVISNSTKEMRDVRYQDLRVCDHHSGVRARR
jgi:hypothetical protein